MRENGKTEEKDQAKRSPVPTDSLGGPNKVQQSDCHGTFHHISLEGLFLVVWGQVLMDVYSFASRLSPWIL